MFAEFANPVANAVLDFRWDLLRRSSNLHSFGVGWRATVGKWFYYKQDLGYKRR